MAAEKVSNVGQVKTVQGTIHAVYAPNARQTQIPVTAPKNAAGQAGTIPAGVPTVLAGNSRATHV